MKNLFSLLYATSIWIQIFFTLIIQKLFIAECFAVWTDTVIPFVDNASLNAVQNIIIDDLTNLQKVMSDLVIYSSAGKYNGIL